MKPYIKDWRFYLILALAGLIAVVDVYEAITNGVHLNHYIPGVYPVILVFWYFVARRLNHRSDDHHP